MQATIIEEDLNKAIAERLDSNLTCSCLLSQVFMRTLNGSKDNVRTSPIFRKGIFLSLNGLYTDVIYPDGRVDAFKIMIPKLHEFMVLFDSKKYDEIRSQLPYSFEFDLEGQEQNGSTV